MLATFMSLNLFGDWEVQFYNDTFGLSGVHFIDTLRGWCAGDNGKILHTADGGNTWSWINTGYNKDLFGVWFVDSFNGWAVGDSGLILHTEDGGNIWSPQSVDTLSHPLYRVQFVNDTMGWIGGKEVLLHTTDGGKNWVYQYPDTLLTWIHDLGFLDENHGWISTQVGEGLYYTSDGGNTWIHQKKWVNTSSFIDTLEGWSLTDSFGEGGIFHTTDGGITWEQLSDIGSYGDIFFLDPYHGWLIALSSACETRDGGITWSCFTPGVVFWREVMFVDTLHGWAVGSYPLDTARTEGEVIHYVPPAGIQEEKLPSCVKIYPNPSVSGNFISLFTETPEIFSVDIYDIAGRKVSSLLNNQRIEGNYTLQWKFLPGVYFCRIKKGKDTLFEKLIILK